MSSKPMKSWAPKSWQSINQGQFSSQDFLQKLSKSSSVNGSSQKLFATSDVLNKKLTNGSFSYDIDTLDSPDEFVWWSVWELEFSSWLHAGIWETSPWLSLSVSCEVPEDCCDVCSTLMDSRGWCVTGSIPIFRSFFFMCVFQWFFISLSVLPGNLAAIFDHLCNSYKVK